MNQIEYSFFFAVDRWQESLKWKVWHGCQGVKTNGQEISDTYQITGRLVSTETVVSEIKKWNKYIMGKKQCICEVLIPKGSNHLQGYKINEAKWVEIEIYLQCFLEAII